MIEILFPFRTYVRDAFAFAFEANGPSNFVRLYRSNAVQIGK